MDTRNVIGRIQHKHDTQTNWEKATTFVPKPGELIVYDVDSTHKNPRFKIGDGTNNVNNLPFTSIECIQGDKNIKSLVINAGNATGEYSIAGGTNDKDLAENLIGYDVSSIADSIIIEKLGNRGLFIKEQADKVSEAEGELSVSYGVGNQSLTALSTTLGIANQAGSKGFYLFKAVGNSDSTITLILSTQHKPYARYRIGSGGSWKDGSNKQSWSNTGIDLATIFTTDDLVSFTLYSSYTLAGKVISVDNSAGTVIISNDLNISNDELLKDISITINSLGGLANALTSLFNAIAPSDFMVTLPFKPHLGLVDVKFGGNAVGIGNAANGNISEAHGLNNIADGTTAFVTGRENTGAFAALVGGYKNTVIGGAGFAAGEGNLVSGSRSSAHGQKHKVTGAAAFVSGDTNEATADVAFSTGAGNKSNGYAAISSGRVTESNGYTSTSNGYYTKAYGTAQFVIGSYNILDNNKSGLIIPHKAWISGDVNNPSPMNNKSNYLFIVGNGTGESARSNAHTLDWSGNAWFAGKGTFHTDVNIIESDGTNHSILDNIKKINGDKNTDGSIAKAVEDMKNSILGEGIKDTYNTLKEIQDWIEGDGVNATELSTAISSKPGAKIASGYNGSEIFNSYTGASANKVLREYCTAFGSNNSSGGYQVNTDEKYVNSSGKELTEEELKDLSINGKLIGSCAFACGYNNQAVGDYSFVTGHSSRAYGSRSFATGDKTKAFGNYSFTMGRGTIADGRSQLVIGEYNLKNGGPTNAPNTHKNDYAFIIGNGTSTTDRKNAATVDWSGNAWFAGDVVAKDYSPDGTESREVSLINLDENLLNETWARKNGDETSLQNAKDYTDQKFSEIVIPEIPDLTPYATTDYVNTQDSETLSQAKAYTDEAVSNIDFPEIDLTGLATEQFVENKTSELSSRIDNITIDSEHSGLKGSNNGTVFNRFNCDNPNTANGVNSATFGTNGEVDVIPEFRGLSFLGYTVSIMYDGDNSVIWSDVNNYDIYNRLCRYMQNISEFRVVLKNAIGNEKSLTAKSIANDAYTVSISGVNIDTLDSDEINGDGSYYIYKIIRQNGSDGNSSFVTGMNNIAQGAATIIGGAFNEVSAGAASSLGHGNLARGYASHASGRVTEARGHSSFTSGRGTFASGAQQFVFGTYNAIDTYNLELDFEGLPSYQYLGGIDNYVENKSKFVHIVGNGTSDIDRKNAYALDWSGNAYFAGDVFVGCDIDSSAGQRIPITYSGTTPPPDDLGKDGDIYIMY